MSVTQASMKALDKNLADITKKRKKAQAELEASRFVNDVATLIIKDT